MRWPWTLIAVLLVVACTLLLPACSNDDNPAEFDCAQWKALTGTARTDAVRKLVAANYGEFEVASDRYRQINDRLDRLIKRLCRDSDALVPAKHAVDSEKARLDPEEDAKGQPTMREPTSRRRCAENEWALYKDDQVTFIDCFRGRICSGSVAQTIDEDARSYFCKKPKQHCQGDEEWAEFGGLPPGIRIKDAATWWGTPKGRLEFDDLFVRCHGPLSEEFCPEVGDSTLYLSHSERANTCIAECDVARFRTNGCADLLDKSTDPGIQEEELP